jgi:hypothetical protein
VGRSRLALVAGLACVTVLAPGCGKDVRERPGATAAGRATLGNTLILGTSAQWTPLLSVRGMGSFSVRCPKGSPQVRLRGPKGVTVHAVVAGRGAPRSAFVNPGMTLAPKAAGHVLLQHWQLGVSTEARANVASVSISASRATAVGNPGCHVAGEATVVRRARTNSAPSG